MYYSSLNEIAEKLIPGYVIKHADGHNLKVISLAKDDGGDYLVKVLENKTKKEEYSLKFLLDKSLILNEDLGFLPKKPSETLVPPPEKPTYLREAWVTIPQKEVEKPKLPSHFVESYSALFSMMDQGDTSHSRYSQYFWHITNAKNFFKIVEYGAFRARFFVEGNIPLDNKIRNETSKEVMSTNLSNYTERHVRFYLRPLNKPFFRMFHNDSGTIQEDLIWVAIGREALSESRFSTFLYPFNAHSAVYEDYSKKYELNHKMQNSFLVHNLNLFDFKEIYSKYDKDQSDGIKLMQQAEFLVWNELSIRFIKKIFFQSDAALNRFLSAIRPLPVYNGIKDKCEVNHDIFHEYK